MLRTLAIVGALILAPTVVAAQQPCTTDARRVVDELYRHILERSADPSSAVHVQRLSSGDATVRDLVRDIANSPEHQKRFFSPSEDQAYLRGVETLYRHVLGRQPDPEGAKGWATTAASRGFGAVVDALVTSPEYQQSFGADGVPGSGGLRYCGPNTQSQAQTDSQPSWRFPGMDRNNDGVIARNEWQGSRESFDVHDWNRDGVLSGDELRSGTRRNDRSLGDENFDRADRFEYLDANNNGRIDRREWHGSAEAFEWLDRNNDNALSRAELSNNGGGGAYSRRAVPTSGRVVTVNPALRWTDTGVVVRVGDTVTFDAEGSAQLSSNPDDVAGPAGSSARRRARATNAPFPQRPAGALIARIGNSTPIFVGGTGSISAQVAGRLYLGVNDDYLQDNSGEYTVMVDVQGRYQP